MTCHFPQILLGILLLRCIISTSSDSSTTAVSTTSIIGYKKIFDYLIPKLNVTTCATSNSFETSTSSAIIKITTETTTQLEFRTTTEAPPIIAGPQLPTNTRSETTTQPATSSEATTIKQATNTTQGAATLHKFRTISKTPPAIADISLPEFSSTFSNKLLDLKTTTPKPLTTTKAVTTTQVAVTQLEFMAVCEAPPEASSTSSNQLLDLKVTNTKAITTTQKPAARVFPYLTPPKQLVIVGEEAATEPYIMDILKCWVYHICDELP